MHANISIPADHPLYNPSIFFFPTPMIGDLKERIEGWIWCGTTGGYVIGNPRIGKTSALQYLSPRLRTRTGEPLPVVRVNLKGRDVKTTTTIWRNLLYAIGQAPASLNEGGDTMATRVIAFLADQSFLNANRQIVLIVDEFQRLDISQLAAFAEIYDELYEMGIHLTVVFIGNDGESEQLLELIEEPHYQYLKSRFFAQQYRSYGLRSHEDVVACLSAMEATRFPADEGPTLIETFLPELHAQHWRLKSLGRPIWQVYREKYGKPLQLESWPMQYFVSTIKTLILDYIPRYGVDSAEGVKRMIRRSLAVSGLPSAGTQEL